MSLWLNSANNWQNSSQKKSMDFLSMTYIGNVNRFHQNNVENNICYLIFLQSLDRKQFKKGGYRNAYRIHFIQVLFFLYNI